MQAFARRMVGSGQRFSTRCLVATMPVAAVMAELIGELGQRDLVLIAGLMGAIPAAVCSWLSGPKMNQARAG